MAQNMKVPAVIDSVDALMAKMEAMRAAQREFATFTQEQVDKIFLAAASAANKQRIALAKMAVKETGMGVVEDKVIKNHYAAEYIYNAYKNTKTCGVLEEDAAYGIKKIAEPIGLIAAVIPTTNPTSTAIFKTLIALKTRNGIIISPHPRAKKSTIEAARIVLEAAVKAGAPEGIIGWIDVPSLEFTNTLMQSADTILATGGPGMVKSAYSSGKPALGVGAGNTPAIIDDSADILLAVNSIIHSKTFDNGMICASEQSVIVLDNIYDKVKAEFEKRGCYFLNAEETEKVRKTIIINGALNAKIVGQKAHTIAKLAGVEVPEKTKILIGEVESVDISEEFAHEKLSPVLAMYKAKDFDDAIEKAEHLIDLIYSIEPLAYYFDMKPQEFWNARFLEISTYCQAHLIKIVDDLKREINLQEAVTNKLIKADSMSKKPKIEPIRNNYKELFKEEEKQEITPEEITRRMREIMKAQKQ